MAPLASKRNATIFFSDSLDPDCHYVRIVLAEKEVNAEIYPVEPNDKPELLLKSNPYNEILTFLDREIVLYEAQVICEYLDERFPHPPLMPIDPVGRANNRLCRYRIHQDLYMPFAILSKGSEKKAAAARRHIRDQWSALLPAFKQKPYFMSEEYSLMDCYLAPLLWRLPHYGIDFSKPSMKPIQEYTERLFTRGAFIASLSAQEKDMKL